MADDGPIIDYMRVYIHKRINILNCKRKIKNIYIEKREKEKNIIINIMIYMRKIA